MVNTVAIRITKETQYLLLEKVKDDFTDEFKYFDSPSYDDLIDYLIAEYYKLSYTKFKNEAKQKCSMSRR